MIITMHYPGENHLEKEIDSQKTIFSTWVKLMSEDEAYREYMDIRKFCTRFIIYNNGERIWNPTSKCKDNDNVVIVAVNKGAYVERSKIKCTEKRWCSCCGDDRIFFYDVNDIFQYGEESGDKEHKAYCKECFIKEFEKFAYRNIEIEAKLDGKIIDIGLSGERDSTIAAYLMTKYINEKKINAKMHGVYNNIGLGYYDSMRQKSALVTAKQLGFECKVNYVDVGLLEEFCKNSHENAMETKFCNICTYLSGWRDVGLYKGQQVISVTGSKTLEDDFVAKIFGTYSEKAQTITKKINILQGLSEDMISLFAAAKRIDYCIADCPIQSLSAQYYCRYNVLNPLKASSNWVFKQNKNKELYSSKPFGLISGKDRLEYFSRTIQRSDLVWVDLTKINKNNYQVIGEDILPEKFICHDALNINYTSLRMKSEENFIKNEAKDFLMIVDEEEFRSRYININPQFDVLLKQYVLLIFEKKSGRFIINPIDRVIEMILHKMFEKRVSVGYLLDAVDREHKERVALFIYKMLRGKVFNIESIEAIEQKKVFKHSIDIYDSELIFEEIINSAPDIGKQIVINYNKDFGSDYKIYISKTFDDLLEYSRNIRSKVPIFIHIGKRITILKGNIEKLICKFEPIDLQYIDANLSMCEKIYLDMVFYEIVDIVLFKNYLEEDSLIIIDKEDSKIDRIKF